MAGETLYKCTECRSVLAVPRITDLPQECPSCEAECEKNPGFRQSTYDIWEEVKLS